MKQRLISIFPALAALILFAALLCDPASAAAGVREGLQLALGTAVPALFPFFLVSSLLISTGCVSFLGKLFAQGLCAACGFIFHRFRFSF